MIVEFQDIRPHRDEKSAENVSLNMPDDIGARFQAHLQGKKDAATPRGRATRQAEIESTL